jgi:hypothetical protein
MLDWIKKAFVRKAEWDKMTPEQREGKRPWGEFVDIERPEVVKALHDLANAQREAYRG